jgi:hypothetical protein
MSDATFLPDNVHVLALPADAKKLPHLTAARIIKKKSGHRSWRPLLENGRKRARAEVRCDE